MTLFGLPGTSVACPPGWRVVPLKTVVVHLSRGMTPKYSDDPTGHRAYSQKCTRPDRTVDVSLGRWQRKPSRLEAERSRLRVNDIVVNATGVGTLGRAGLITPADLTEAPAYADSHVCVVRVDEEQVIAAYLWYLMSTQSFYDFVNAALAVGSTNQTELAPAALGNLRVALPPIDMQHRLTTTLDRQCGHIAAVNVEQDGHLALVEERYSAMVDEAFDPLAHPLWRLKFLAEGALAYGASAVGTDNPEWPRFIRTTDVAADGTLKEETAKYMAPTVAKHYPLRDGDLLLTRSGSVGKSFLYRDTDGPACWAGYMIRVRPDQERVIPDYLKLWTESRSFWDQVRQVGAMATIENVNAQRYGNFAVPLRSLPEQDLVVRRLLKARAHTHRVRAERAHQRDLLAEHRIALITAAATGQTEAAA